MSNLVEANNSNVSFYFSVRFLISVVAFIGYCVLNMQRVILSIAIICMVNNTAISKLSHSSTITIAAANQSSPLDTATSSGQYRNESQTSECVMETSRRVSGVRDGEFAWNKDTQGLVLSSFFYGYLCTRKLNYI